MHFASADKKFFTNINAALKPIDFSRPIVDAGVEKEYFRFYKINFEEKIEDVDHYFGTVSSGRYQIATHFFKNKVAHETCFILHGYYDHAGLYRHAIEYYLRKNYSVVIFDLPGHGLSSGALATIADFSEYQQVLADIIARFKDKAPAPWHAFAQSTGGAILSEFQLTSGKEVFNNIVLSAPLIYPVLWGRSILKYKLFKYFIKKIDRVFVDNSNDKQFLEFLKNGDPLQANILPLQWIGALELWIERFLAFPVSKKAVLIIQGKDDGTVEWKKNMPLFKQKFPNATIHMIAAARHQLINESEEIRREVFSVIDDFCAENIS